MTGRATPIRIQTSAAKGGVMTYLVSAPPETLPPVLPRELERAWHARLDEAHAIPREIEMTRANEGLAEVTLDTLPEALDGILAGRARGRWIVRIGE